jgi:hypothetical protein
MSGGRALPASTPLAHAPAPALELVPALTPRSRAVRRHGIPSSPQVAARELELRLPGIGGRYLAGVAHHLAAHGWPGEEAAALLVALEDRCSMWIVCSPGDALARAGLAPDRPARLRRVRATRFAGGRWDAARVPLPETVAELMAAGTARGAVCAAAESGRLPPSGLVRAAAMGGAHTASMDGGLAAAVGARWAVELLIAPAIPSGSLVGLREQIAGAPRCGWCRAPLVGSTCRRCAPAIRA